MNDRGKTKAQLIEELVELRQKVERLESVQAKTEKALQESEARYQLLFDTAPVAIYIKDVDGRYTSVNANTLTYWSRNPVGYTDGDLLPERIAAQLRAADKQVMETKRDLVLKERIETPDGIRTVLTHKVPILDTMGEVTHVLGASLDITKGEQVEAILQKRATELETVAQVGTAAATILDVDELLQRVVDLTQERFGLYHAHIYLFSPKNGTLDLTAGAGDVGRQMVAENWHIPIDQEQSLVAWVARHREGRIANNVRTTSDWLPNAYLPETQAELAVPMIVGQELLGVLDIQSDQTEAFTETDISIQTILASQVAVALYNARLFARSQLQVEQERVINQIIQRIQSTVTVESALQMAVQEVGRALKAKQVRVELAPDNGISGPSNNGVDTQKGAV